MSTFTKEIIAEGTGPQIQPRQKVTVSADLYIASTNQGIWSTHKSSGFLFSATNGPQPFTYGLIDLIKESGVGSVVRGWEDGVASMKVGEHARLSIPWQYAYGEKGHPGFKIGPKSDLVFEIKVMSANLFAISKSASLTAVSAQPPVKSTSQNFPVMRKVYRPIHERPHNNDIIFLFLYCVTSVAAISALLKETRIPTLSFLSSQDIIHIAYSMASCLVFITLFLLNASRVSYLILSAVPVLCVGFIIALLSLAVNTFTIIYSIILLVLVGFSLRVINSHGVTDAVKVLEVLKPSNQQLSSNMILRYPVLPLSSLFLMVPYAFFTTSLINLFSTLVISRTWLGTYETGIVVLWYLWTCQMIKYFLKVVITSVVAQDYFFDPNQIIPDEEAKTLAEEDEEDTRSIDQESLLPQQQVSSQRNLITFKEIAICAQSTATKQMGTIAFASLIIASLDGISIVLKTFKKSNPFHSCAARGFGFLKSFAETSNSYILSFVGITGQDLITSARSVTQVLRRNLIRGLTCTSILRILYAAISTTIPILSGMLICASGGDASRVAVVVYVGSLMGMFASSVLGAVADALFMCYLCDVDEDLVGKEDVHSVYHQVSE